jgi:hypothetical protein
MATSTTLAKRAKDFAAWQASLPKRPKRRRPTDFRGEAITFLGAALQFLEQNDRANTTLQAALWIPVVFSQYARQSGLRGREKASVYFQVRELIREAKLVEALERKNAQPSKS